MQMKPAWQLHDVCVTPLPESREAANSAKVLASDTTTYQGLYSRVKKSHITQRCGLLLGNVVNRKARVGDNQAMSFAPLTNDTFLRACRRQATDYTPR